MATRDYTLGKGKVLFQPEGTDGYIDLGNAPAFAINVAIEKLEHFSSREGLSKKDLEVITKLGMGGSFTLDEPNAQNLAMFVMSTAAASAAQTSGSTAAASIANVVLDRWYPLTVAGTGADTFDAEAILTTESTGSAVADLTGNCNAQTTAHSVKVQIIGAGTTGTTRVSLDGGDWSAPVARTTSGTDSVYTFAGELLGLVATFDVAANLVVGDEYTFMTYLNGAARLSNITALTVSGSVEGVDFVVDKAAGLFMAYEAGNIVAGSTVAFATTTYGANAAKTSTTGATLNSLKGNLYFVGNPPVGRILDIQGYCSLTPNGDFSLIGTDWMQMQFNVEFLSVENVDGLISVTDRGKA